MENTPYFLPYALPGETVKAKVSYIKRNLVYGVLTPCPETF
jgi:tRNA/tmRNA/rRNA uracil-C5-methylase (TrmA/RlmC/RlmD family)